MRQNETAKPAGTPKATGRTGFYLGMGKAAGMQPTARPRSLLLVNLELDGHVEVSDLDYLNRVGQRRGAARGAEPLLHLLVMRKAFQQLGYFPVVSDVPAPVRWSTGLPTSWTTPQTSSTWPLRN